MPRRFLICLLLLVPVSANAAEPSAERGKKALTETAFIKAFWPKPAYDNLWRVWGLKEKPNDYESAVHERFGLHPAPYQNNGYPMGLRKADLVIGKGGLAWRGQGVAIHPTQNCNTRPQSAVDELQWR